MHVLLKVIKSPLPRNNSRRWTRRRRRHRWRRDEVRDQEEATRKGAVQWERAQTGSTAAARSAAIVTTQDVILQDEQHGSVGLLQV